MSELERSLTRSGVLFNVATSNSRVISTFGSNSTATAFMRSMVVPALPETENNNPLYGFLNDINSPLLLAPSLLGSHSISGEKPLSPYLVSASNKPWSQKNVALPVEVDLGFMEYENIDIRESGLSDKAMVVSVDAGVEIDSVIVADGFVLSDNDQSESCTPCARLNAKHSIPSPCVTLCSTNSTVPIVSTPPEAVP